MAIDTFGVLGEEAARVREMYGHGRLEPGVVYTRLRIAGVFFMADTPDEYAAHEEAIARAAGRVLLNGLGLGCMLHALLARPQVSSVDVVELLPDVLGLVSPSFPDPRVSFVWGDALTHEWPADARWDLVWSDLWPTKSARDDRAREALRARFAGRCGWHGAWAAGFEEEAAERRQALLLGGPSW